MKFNDRDKRNITIGLCIVVVWIGMLMFGPGDGSPRQGDRCGPHHHWVYVTADIYGSDLSCEDDE